MKLITAAYILGMAWVLMPQVSSAGDAPIGAKLWISVTNRSGDVFTNLVVDKILADGLVLEHPAGQLKVKYEDLPQEVREKYQPLAAVAESRERTDAAANAAFVAAQRRAQVEQAKVRRLQAQQQPGQQPTALGKLRIEIPKQGWGITVLNPGFRELGKDMNEGQFAYQAIARDGFNLSIFVEKPGGLGLANSDVFNFYWPKASRNPLIDEKSVKAETKEKFVKVSYTCLGIPNVNYYFASNGKWVDVHVSKTIPSRDDEKLFADFEENLSYGD